MTPGHPSEPAATGWLDRLIVAARRALRSGWVLAGASITLALFCATLTATALLDMAAPLGTALRASALGLILLPTAWGFAMGVARPLARRLPASSVARRIEAHVPGMNDRLVTSVELARNEAVRAQSPAFFARLLGEVRERIRGFRPATLRDARRLRRAGAIGMMSVAVLAASWLTFADRLPTAMARIFRPFADIPPATGVAFAVTPGDAHRIEGEPVRFEAEVTQGDPDLLRLQVFTADGEYWHDLARAGDSRWGITLEGMSQSLWYRVHGGGTWSRLHRIEMIPRPLIAGLRAERIDPGYLGATPHPQEGLAVKGVAGSTVTLEVEARGEVVAAEVELLEPTTRDVPRPESERRERAWFQERYPEGVIPDGTWHWDFRLLGRPAHTDLARDGHHWHRFTGDPHGLYVAKDDTLFAYAYVYPGEEPLALLIAWHDDESWEHRAYWGGNQIGGGKEGTPGRQRMGPVPEAGQWVRLEVPAEAVGLAGKALRGISFEAFNGRVDWHRVGVLPPRTVTVEEQLLVKKYPLSPASEGGATWTGRFPLDRDGSYRVVLRNSLDVTSAPMREAGLTALPDRPPTIDLEHPGKDIELTSPRKVPLTIAAADDFGIAEIVLFRMESTGRFVGTTIASYPEIKTRARINHTFDLTALNLKQYQTLRFHIAVTDKKGQTTLTPDCEIRINPKGEGADKGLAKLDRRQERLREQVKELAKRQAQVNAATKRAAEEHAEALEAIRKAEDPDAARKRPELSDKLDNLRRAVSKAADPQEQARQEADRLRKEVGEMLKDAEQQSLLPEQMAGALRDVERLLGSEAEQPMRQLAGAMRRGADFNQPLPDPEAMNKAGEEIKENLEAIDRRLANLDGAFDRLEDDPVRAAEQMARENLGLDAERAAKSLSALEKSLGAVDKRMEGLEKDEDEILKAVREAPDHLMEELGDVQDKVSAEADQVLAELDRLMQMKSLSPKGNPVPRDAESARKAKQEPRPGEPGAENKRPEQKKSRAGESPSGEEQKQSKKANTGRGEQAGQGARKQKKGSSGEGEQQAGAKKEKNAGGKSAGQEQAPPRDREEAPGSRRREIAGQGEETRDELQEGRERLRSDQDSLGQLRDQLGKVARGEMESSEAQQAMQSEQLQQALEMAAQAGQGQPGQDPAQPAKGGEMSSSTPSKSEQGNVDGKPATISAMESRLAELDPNSRAAILRMQPQLRDELLKGMNEQAPEGYDGFIREYFRRLTSAQSPR